MSTAFLIKQILWGVFIPAIISGVIFLLLRHALGAWIGAIGIALGYFVAHRSLYTLADFRPTLGLSDWLPYIALIALAWALIEQLWWRFRWGNIPWLRWVARLVLVELMATRFLWTKITHRLERFRWDWYESALYLSAIGIIVLTIWFLLEQRSIIDKDNNDRSRAILPSALVLYFALLSGSTLFSHAGISAQQIGILAATLGAIMVLCWFSPRFYLAVPAVSVISILSMLFLTNGFFFADMPWYTVVLFTITPTTLLLPLPKMPVAAQTAARLSLLALPTLAATALTFFVVY